MKLSNRYVLREVGGRTIGRHYGRAAEIIGGAVLLAMGIGILIK